MPTEPVSCDQPAYDLLIQNGAVISVFTGETFLADVAIKGETIAAILAPGSIDVGQAAEVLDASSLTVAPSYIDAHMHVESSFVTPASFAWLTLPRGTTTVLADPHEIVNVAGKPGLRWMIEAGQGTGQTMLLGDRVAALLHLPVGGLMSDRPVSEVVAGAKVVRAALHAWGYRHANAFMSVSTLSLPVSPALKLTDQGLVDVDRRAWADAVASHA